jgi:sugar lactone lactonase YvrE
MEKGTVTTSASQVQTVVLKTSVIPKGSVAATLQTCASSLSSFCLDNEDRFLVCDSMNKRIRVLTADDKLVKDIALNFGPQVVACRADGSILAAGNGEIALLNSQGVKQASAELPSSARTATSIGAHGQDVFVCVQAKTGYAIYRLSDKLQSPTEIVKGLRGCCGQMDFKVQDGFIFVAHNTKFLVEKYDRDGKLLSSFGKRDDGTSKSWKGCCEPKNICFDKQGNLYTAESSNWTVKKYSAAGNYINFFGTIAETGDCVRATIVCTKDNRIYMLDHPRNIIRPVLPGKSKEVSTRRS